MPSYTLRPYQQEAVNAAIDWVKKNSEPALLSLSGGAGKSLICAEIARIMYQMTGKRILVLVPNQDLLIQNGEKMQMTGEKFSYYSASVSKSLRHHIVLATEGTFKAIAKERGHEFTMVIVDECDRVTPTFKQIIDDMREGNPLLRVIGMTGTPFRSLIGYIYELDLNNKITQEAVDPYYKKMLYSIGCDELISQGHLTPVQIGISSESYDTSGIKLSGEDFTDSELKKTFEDKTVTQKIVDDFVKKTIGDPFGVIVFCATVKHAQEVFDLLPEGKAVLLHGGLSNAERKKAIHLYKTQQVKYLVNRDIASVGFDAPWSAHCVLMRSIGSNRLAQQMFWRVVRLYDGKEVSTIHDYGNNIESLFNGSSDIFTPQIKAYGSKPSVQIEVMCEYCGTSQEFSKRQGFEQWDPFGYAVDLTGDRLEPPVPAHHGRRCTGVTPLGKNQFARCDYYWTCKECPACQHKNDIAARQCESCGLVMINPEDKLSETATFIPVGEQATTVINSMSVRHGEVLHVEWETPHGTLKSRFFPNHKQWAIAHHGKKFLKETDHGNKPPKMITYTKQKTGYCSINEYHQV